MLKEHNFAPGNWARVYGSGLVDDRDVWQAVEGMIVQHLNVAEHLPPTSWLDEADARFGWSADGVGFLRRCPFAHLTLAVLVARKRGPVRQPKAPRNIAVGLALMRGCNLVSAVAFGNDLGTPVPGLVVLSLILALMAVGGVTFVGSVLLHLLPDWLSDVAPSLLDRRFALRLWLGRRVWRINRLCAVVGFATLIAWAGFMVFVFDLAGCVLCR